MRKFSLGYKLGLAALLSVAFYSCKKVNGINNNNIVETPYGLYFADSSGALYNTNDGITFSPIVFNTDGFPPRALCISGDNLLMVKSNLYYAINGFYFNHAYDSVSQVPSAPADSAINGLPIRLNQSMILNASDEKRLYITSNAPNNKLGIAYSGGDGAPGTWVSDTAIDTSVHKVATVTSFTELTSNMIVAYDAIGNRFFNRSGASAQWVEVKSTDSSRRLPDHGFFSLGHYNKLVIAIDNSGQFGAWYSSDNGGTWYKYAGIPANVPLLSVASPFDQTLLIGTDSAGLYRLNTTTNNFELNTNGLENNTVVWGITAKQNIYKNNTRTQYIYLVTNKGLYQSTDAGQNWIVAKKGNFVSIY